MLHLPHLWTLSSTPPINGDDILDKLIPDFWSFLTQLIAFIILIVVVTFLIYKPVKKMLSKRKENIEKEIKEAEDKNKEAAENVESSKNLIKESHVEADKIIASAKNEAIKQADLIKQENAKEIVQMKEEAKKDIAKEQTLAKEQLKNDVVDVAILMSSKILEREVKKEDNEKIIDELLKEGEDHDR